MLTLLNRMGNSLFAKLDADGTPTETLRERTSTETTGKSDAKCGNPTANNT
jgi:hypothetical protein